MTYRVHSTEEIPTEFISSLSTTTVLGFAGSRHLEVPPPTCQRLLSSFLPSGTRFAVGCAPGVDSSFHQLLVDTCKDRASFFRAFSSRDSLGLEVSFTSPDTLRPAWALASRTRALTKACTHIVLFPFKWGPGSRLCLRLAEERGLKILIVTI